MQTDAFLQLELRTEVCRTRLSAANRPTNREETKSGHIKLPSVTFKVFPAPVLFKRWKKKKKKALPPIWFFFPFFLFFSQVVAALSSVCLSSVCLSFFLTTSFPAAVLPASALKRFRLTEQNASTHTSTTVKNELRIDHQKNSLL